jgi:hypothetical protein
MFIRVFVDNHPDKLEFIERRLLLQHLLQGQWVRPAGCAGFAVFVYDVESTVADGCGNGVYGGFVKRQNTFPLTAAYYPGKGTRRGCCRPGVNFGERAPVFPFITRGAVPGEFSQVEEIYVAWQFQRVQVYQMMLL